MKTKILKWVFSFLITIAILAITTGAGFLLHTILISGRISIIILTLIYLISGTLFIERVFFRD